MEHVIEYLCLASVILHSLLFSAYQSALLVTLSSSGYTERTLLLHHSKCSLTKNLHAVLTPRLTVWNLFFLMHGTVHTSTSVLRRHWGVAVVLLVWDTSKCLFSSFVASAFEKTYHFGYILVKQQQRLLVLSEWEHSIANLSQWIMVETKVKSYPCNTGENVTYCNFLSVPHCLPHSTGIGWCRSGCRFLHLVPFWPSTL